MQPRQRPLFCRLLLSLSFFILLAGPAKVEAQLNASFTVSATSGCTPLTVQFTNTSTGAVSYYWDFGNGNFSTAVNPSNVYLSPGNFSVKLVAYSAGGAADSVVLQNAIQVVHPPVASFTASPRTVCLSGNQVSFTNLSSGFDSCFWDFGDGVTSTANNPVHHYSGVGTYSVTLITYNTGMGCQSSFTQQSYIQVIGSLSANMSVNQTSTCDSSAVFQFSGSAASAWYWTFGDGTSSALQNPSHAYYQSGNFSVTLVATDSQGCVDTVTLGVPIQVKSNPRPDLSIVSTQGVCAPSQVTFNAAVNGNPTYSWNFGDSTFAFTAGPVSHYYNPGSFVPTLTVTYPNGCVNGDTLSVLNFYNNPVPYFFASTMQACAPASISFSAFNPGNFSGYLWDFGDGSTSSSPNPVHVYSTPGSYLVSLTTTTPSGCVNSYVLSQHVLVSSLNAAFTADDLSGCVPHTVNFSFPGSSGMTYSWDFGDGNTSSQMSPSHTYNTNGNYTVTLAVSDASGCAASFTLPSQVQVTNGVNNFSPAPPISACAPFTVNLFDNSPATSSWSWDFGDGTTSTDQNPTHTYMTPGTYQVSLTTQSTGSNCSQFVNPYRIYIIKGGEAEFDVTQTICPPYTATFTDQSVNAASWLWDFGDGTTSTLQHPVHVYSAPGNYNVTLTITTTDGCVYEKVHNYAVTFLPLTANATAVTTDTILPMNVQFYANSIGATAWFWDFGDGGTSTLMNPIHTYTGSGPYNVTLTISNPGCSFTYVYTGVTIGSGAIIPGGPPDSLHVPDPVFSCIPYEMNFNNPVLNTVAWLWDFGDGDTSTQENPVHIYTDAGTFTVTLITWDAFGNTDTVVQPSAINLIGAEADFVFSNMNNCQGSTILTTNSSTNAFSYMWDFGDGTTSTQFEPTHTYNTTGVNYIISLTVTDSGGCTDFMSRSYYAASVSAISANTRKACANDTVYFDSGSLNYVTYLWDFGDGTTSALQNPWHVYADSGSYGVTLTVTDTANCVITYTLPYNIKVNKPVAAFNHQVIINGCSAMTVQLTNQSTGADSWYWDFGNGVTSSQLNPVASYPLSQWGSHDITLVAFASGCADTFTVSNAITVPHLTADFSFTQSSECFPITATFTDLSTDAVTWHWEFGDGTTSSANNPLHVYDSLPAGDVKLVVTDILGCMQSKTLPKIQAMVADFNFSDTAGCKPFVLSVTDSSSGVVGWNWSFGDGTVSNLSNPVHQFNSTGNFNVTLTATAASGCTQVIGPNLVTVTGPLANFTSATVVSCAPTIVNFQDLSSGAGQWSWDFGDGGTSVVSDPVHVYNQPGTYDVTLAITDSIGCSDTLMIPDMVHITGSIANFSVTAASGCSPWQVTFADSSISAFTWQWNFGDGNTSSQQNPVHTYSTPGTYTVTLMTQDTTGCQSVFSSQTPISILQPPVAAFATTDTVGCAPFDVNFQQNSVSAASWFWDFGDGNVSSAAAPSHTYQQPGVYTVTLIVSSPDGCSDTLVYANMIKVGITPQPSFIPSVTQGCPPLQVQFYNTSVDTVSGSVFAWSFGNGVAGAGFQPSYSFQQPGVYDITLQVTNPYGCVASVTSPALIQVLNNAPLPPVQLRSVSVQDAASIEITWGNLAAQNLGAYELYRFNDMSGAFDLIYTDLNPGNSSMNVNSVYTDTGLNTTDKSYTYVARAVNTCAVATPMASLQQHSSVNVEAVEQNGNVQVTWNSYGGCPVSGYEVYREDQLSGSFVMIASVGASDLSFLDTTLYCGMDVSYRIKALSVCGLPYDAWSDTSVTEVPGTIISQPVGVVRSTVVDDSFVLTEWAPPTQMPQTVTGYEIYRSADGNSFDLLTVVPAFQTSYEDHGVDVDAANYFYRVKVVNICQLDPGMGTMGSSIWLQTAIDDENISKLRWTRYEYWDTGVDYYVIERMDLNGGWKVIGTVPGSQTDYTDR